MSRAAPPADPRGGHVRLYWTLIDSPAWASLSATDQRAYVALRRALGKTNNGDLSLPLSRARHYRITSPATLAKALRALNAVGLIAVTRKGGCTRGGQRLPTLYRFTDEAVYPMPAKLIEGCKATDEWKAVKSIGAGKDLIRQAERAARERAEKKRLLHSSNATAIADEAVKLKSATAIESWLPPPLQALKQANEGPGRRKASKDTALNLAASLVACSAPPFKE